MAQTVAANAAKSKNHIQNQIQYCFQQILGREPTPSEMKIATTFIAEQSQRIAKDSPAGAAGTSPQQMALADFCLGLFNLNEFVYVD